MSVILTAENIKKSYGHLKVVDDVSFDIKKGQTVAIIGPSGCGKTTLARIIVGLIKPDQGQIITNVNMQMVFQDPQSSLDPLYPIRDILNEAFYLQKHLDQAARLKEMQQALIDVGLEPAMLERFPHEFSGGQRQRIAIARALLFKPQILILDEVTSALDVLVQKQIIDLLTSLKSKLHLTYIFISHNQRVVKQFADKIWVMQQGKFQ